MNYCLLRINQINQFTISLSFVFFLFLLFSRKVTDSLKLELGIKTTDLLNLNVKVDEYERINREILQENVLLKGKEEDHIKQVNIILRKYFLFSNDFDDVLRINISFIFIYPDTKTLFFRHFTTVFNTGKYPHSPHELSLPLSLSLFLFLSLSFIRPLSPHSLCLFVSSFVSLSLYLSIPPRFPILFSPSSAVDRSIKSRERGSGKYDIISR